MVSKAESCNYIKYLATVIEYFWYKMPEAAACPMDRTYNSDGLLLHYFKKF